MRLSTRALLLGATLFSQTAWADGPNVVVSIPPLHGLTASIMEGVGTPELLVKGNASPHSYALRPSEAQLLQDANLVVWIGADLETFLEKALTEVAVNAKNLSIMEVDGLELLASRDLEAFGKDKHDHGHEEHADHKDEHGHDHEEHADHKDEHGHDHEEHADHKDEHDHEEHAGGDHHDHHHGEFDPHIWLHPDNGIAAARAISAALIELDPANASKYSENTAALIADIESVESELEAQLSPLHDAGFVVFHDAYQYFETAFDIKASGVVTLTPEQRPSAQQIRDVREKLSSENVTCIFQETQFDNRIVQSLTDDAGLKIGTLDPLGGTLSEGPGRYQATLRAMADNLTDCLGS